MALGLQGACSASPRSQTAPRRSSNLTSSATMQASSAQSREPRAPALSTTRRRASVQTRAEGDNAAAGGGEKPAASTAVAETPPPPSPLPAKVPSARPALHSTPAAGVVYLLLVAMLWGSYTPVLRIAYSLPGPPSPMALAAITAIIELLALFAAALYKPPPSGKDGQQAAAAAAGDEKAAQHAGQNGASAEKGEKASRYPFGLPPAVLGGLEIGAYNSGASLTQIAGLSFTTATRGAFLIQTTTLFTPVLSALTGSSPSRSVWLGSAIAFAGTLIIAADHAAAAGAESASAAAGAAAAAAAQGLPWGDLLTLGAALFYSASTVRIPAWAVGHKVPPLQLAIGKAVVLTAASVAGAAIQAATLVAQGQPLVALWPGWQDPLGWALVIWAALGPGAVASVLHVKGQSLVSPSAAQIAFCTVPLWSAFLAALFLPGEAVGQLTWLGGLVVAGAGLVVALGKRSSSAAAEQASGGQ